jgi:hypothetical protein
MENQPQISLTRLALALMLIFGAALAARGGR